MRKQWMICLAGLAVAGAVLMYPAGGQGQVAAAGDKQKEAAERMVAAAQIAIDELRAKAAVVRVTPEFLELRISWNRKLLDAQLLLNPAAVDRVRYLEAYVAETKKLAAEIERRRDIDADQVSIAEAQFAVAEAEYRAAAK